jgi:hypothetical protein
VVSRFPNLILRVALKWRAGFTRDSAYIRDDFTPWGTPGQLVEGTVLVQMAERKSASSE